MIKGVASESTICADQKYRYWLSESDYLSCYKRVINEIGGFEAKTEESEKAGSRCESNPGHLWLEPPVLCH